MVALELFNAEPHGFDRARRDRFQKSIGNRSVDRETADIETVLPTTVDDVLAGAVVTGPRVPATIMCE
jgi:hypothetical protein